VIIRRILAFLIDALLAGLISLIPVIGLVVGILYLLLRDGLTKNGSVGKTLLKLHVTTIAGQRLNYGESLRRNFIFFIPYLFAIVPLIGWLLGFVAALLICLLELLAMHTHPQGMRFGDRWGGTIVREAVSYYNH